jgi:hypothetical protein
MNRCTQCGFQKNPAKAPCCVVCGKVMEDANGSQSEVERMKALSNIFGTAASLLLIPFFTAVRGFVFMSYWNWFAVPCGMNPLKFAQACSLWILWALMMLPAMSHIGASSSKPNKTGWDMAGGYLRWILVNMPLAYGIGYAWHLALHALS